MQYMARTFRLSLLSVISLSNTTPITYLLLYYEANDLNYFAQTLRSVIVERATWWWAPGDTQVALKYS